MSLATIHKTLSIGAVAILSGFSSAFPAKVQIDLPVVTQERTEWCWAGVASSVLGFYNKTVTQCQIANFARTTATWHDFGKEDCCTKGSGACNYWNYNYGRGGSIQEILKNWGVGNNGLNRPLTLAEVATQLEASRPFIIRWALVSSGGHFIVGRGVSDSNLLYMDPWPGEGAKIAKYSWVVSNSAKSWAETNVLTTSPTASSVATGAAPTTAVSGSMLDNRLVVSYSLETASPVEFRIQSLQGKVIETFGFPTQSAGAHAQSLSGLSLPPGGYILQLRAGETRARTMLFVGR